MELLTDLTGYHWFVLGLLLLAAEALGAAGFLLGGAIAAIATGMLVWLFPDLAVGVQLGIFAFATLLATVLYLQVFRDVQDEDEDGLNDRAGQLIGRRLVLDEPLAQGEGRTQIGDTLWRVRADSALDAGTEVEVVGATDMTLEVRPLHC